MFIKAVIEISKLKIYKIKKCIKLE